MPSVHRPHCILSRWKYSAASHRSINRYFSYYFAMSSTQKHKQWQRCEVMSRNLPISTEEHSPTITSVMKISKLNQMKYVSMENWDMAALHTGFFSLFLPIRSDAFKFPTSILCLYNIVKIVMIDEMRNEMIDELPSSCSCCTKICTKYKLSKSLDGRKTSEPIE